MSPARAALVVVVVVVVVGGVATSTRAQELEGFAEVRGAYLVDVDGVPWQLVERARPTFTAEVFPRLTLTTTVEVALVQGRDVDAELFRVFRGSDAWPALQAAGYEPPSYGNRLLRVDDRHGYLDVDRLHLDLYAGRVDLRVGRQALNWGSAQFFNPTDPFPEVLLAEPWRPRRGVNALRATVPFDAPFDLRADATVVAALDDALAEPRAAGRARVNVAGVDVAVAAAFRGRDHDALVGVDVRGTFVVGWWLEAAWLFPDEPHEEIALGVDYSFPVLERLTVAAQYYRNGGGEAHPAPPTNALATRAARADDPYAPFVRARDYLLVASSLAVLPELSFSAAALQNLVDRTGVFIPTAAWFPLDWLEVAGSATLPYAVFVDGGEFVPRARDLVLTIPPGHVVDLDGLSPRATFTVWTRVHY